MSDQYEPTDPLETARDRLTDRVLAEAIGAEGPPDLTDAILDRVAADQSSPSQSGARTMRTRRAWIAWLTTAASLAVGTVLLRGQGTVEGEVARKPEVIAEFSSVRATEARAIPSSRSTEEVEAIVASIKNQPTPADDRLLRDSLASTSGLSKGLGVQGSPSAPPVAPQLNALALKPGQVLDNTELRNSERRLGASSLFNTSPAQGSPPADKYRISEETKRRLAERQARSGAPTRQANEQVEVAGRSLPSPYYLADDVEHLAAAESAPAAMPMAPRSKRPVAGTDFALRGRPAVTLDYIDGFREADELGRRHPKGRGESGQKEALRFARPSRDRYAAIEENPFIKPTGTDALSTFSIDVDTASYTNVRQYLMQSRRLPPPSAVRVEELVNYFGYGYEGPTAESEDPFAASMEVQLCPWAPTHQLVRIGIKGREVTVDKRPLSNLVFLVDVSGSMNQPNKLPLVVAGLTALTDRLGENDLVAIVVYAGSEGVVLPSTSGEERDTIRSALGRLQAGGSTAGGAGLKLAYEIAERNQIPGGVNRVILCTDGDFNVGLSGTEELTKLVETRAKETGVFLTVLGFGRGNLNDAMLESISGRGDGHYAYIDSEREARRVLSRDLSGTLVTIAKDVKLQVEFNPAKVGSYRLIGYENRVMAAKDFNDDTKDAGEIGAGHTVTALYEVVPVGAEPVSPPVDGLKYQQADGSGQAAEEERNEPVASAPGQNPEPTAASDELLTLKIRYKQPTGGASKKLEFPLAAVDLDAKVPSRLVSDDFRWAATVAEFGLLLRNSQHAGEASFDGVLDRARGALGEDPRGERAELLDLVRRAKQLRGE